MENKETTASKVEVSDKNKVNAKISVYTNEGIFIGFASSEAEVGKMVKDYRDHS